METFVNDIKTHHCLSCKNAKALLASVCNYFCLSGYFIYKASWDGYSVHICVKKHVHTCVQKLTFGIPDKQISIIFFLLHFFSNHNLENANKNAEWCKCYD